MGALRRYWEWAPRMFRRNGGARPGERAGVMVGLAVVLIGIVVTVVPLTAR